MNKDLTREVSQGVEHQRVVRAHTVRSCISTTFLSRCTPRSTQSHASANIEQKRQQLAKQDMVFPAAGWTKSLKYLPMFNYLLFTNIIHKGNTLVPSAEDDVLASSETEFSPPGIDEGCSFFKSLTMTQEKEQAGDSDRCVHCKVLSVDASRIKITPLKESGMG